MYINCHSSFSLRYGVLSETELLMQAQQKGFSSLAITDINNTSACLSFIREAPKYGIKPVTGIDFRNGIEQKFVGIAKSNRGFEELNTLLSTHLHTRTAFPDAAPFLPDTAVIYPFSAAARRADPFFGDNEYIGVASHEVGRIRFSKLASQTGRMVLLDPVTFRDKQDFNVHRLLRAIDNNTLLQKLEPAEQAFEYHRMTSMAQLTQQLSDYPFLLRNTAGLLEECQIGFKFGAERESQNLRYFTENDTADFALLKQLCDEGLKYRYGQINATIESRLEKELELIRKMGFVSFFLVNHEIVNYAHSKGYFYVGRGSGANSIVAYLLRITNVDPIELDLYFERFLNLYRISPPDFDLDFSSLDREDVTRHIFARFGTNGQAALLATYNTFQFNASVRELGKVFGLPAYEIDKLAESKSEPVQNDQLGHLTLKYARRLQDMPNHLSVHAGGIVISERPIQHYCATFLPPKGFPTTQFDMVIAEDVGLNKFDILGQRGLAKIKESLRIIRYNRPEVPEIDIDDVKVFMSDPKVNRLVSQAECIGCFYVESPAMRMLLRKLEVDNYLGLVAASSIIRPGVAKSGMMREYILRHRNSEKQSPVHPVLLDLMPETYGVMVYQEDVIKVAHYFAGLSLGEADVLRRGMSGKFRSREEFTLVRDQFFRNCRAKKYEEQTIQAVWMQIESFAGYAFAKGHSASYAVESYQTLFLKTYYPLEFLVSVLNSGGGFYSPELYVHEARALGATIYAPDVNRSRSETIISGKDIYLGMGFLAGIESKVVKQLVGEREANGVFASLDDFLERVPVSVEQISILIRINAFRFTGEDKRSLLWRAHYFQQKSLGKVVQNQLFRPESKRFTLPEFIPADKEEAFDQIELLGFPLCSPFELLLHRPESDLTMEDVKLRIGEEVVIYGYLITQKNTRTGSGDRMHFGTFTDKRGHFIDTVHFPVVARQFPFRGKGVYRIAGKVVDEFGFLSIEVSDMQKQAYMEDPRYADK